MPLEAEGFQIKTHNDGASALEGSTRRRPTSPRYQDADGMEPW
jgi:hypothetical protein